MLARVELGDSAPGIQGIRRRLPISAIVRLDLAVALAAIGTPSAAAVHAATVLRREGTIALRPHLTLRYDPQTHEAELADRLREAAERVITRRRGRPTKREA
jgi:hypothetical protein